MRRGEYWRLNPVGAEVFAALATGDVDPVAAVTDRFEVEVSVARRDAAELIDQLRGIGLVVP
ncbi:PqqD family peptide modification chaperone [Nocardia asteroides]|uniref:PqqD family peptide modification chaperone n=1 Tax=Nocardia asteroides TaxID=1824 RepID=UPI0036556549